jgi:Zn-dependent protease with chaperone function
MLPSVIVALAVAFLAAVAPHALSRKLRPALATKAVATLAGVSAAATLWVLALLTAENVVQLHGIAERFSWCSGIAHDHRDRMNVVGLVSIGLLLVITASMLRVGMRHRSQRAADGASELVVLDSIIPSAFALPGKPGQVVVSTGMLNSLVPEERRVLLAHERAHLRCRHHRYIRVTELASAAMPALAPLRGKVRHATERWADEEAVKEVGDPHVVAYAIAHAAIARSETPAGALGMADSGVLERVEELLSRDLEHSAAGELAARAVTFAALAGLALSIALVQPLAARLLGLCH